MKPSIFRRLVLVSALSCATTLALPKSDSEGKPEAFQPGAVSGAAVWTDGTGLHVRFTARGGPRRYTGKVCGKEQARDLVVVDGEGDDAAWIGPEGKCVWFKFSADEGLDGFDAIVSGAVVFFDLRRDQAALPAAEIWVGRAGKHPEHNPFTLE